MAERSNAIDQNLQSSSYLFSSEAQVQILLTSDQMLFFAFLFLKQIYFFFCLLKRPSFDPLIFGKREADAQPIYATLERGTFSNLYLGGIKDRKEALQRNEKDNFDCRKYVLNLRLRSEQKWVFEVHVIGLMQRNPFPCFSLSEVAIHFKPLIFQLCIQLHHSNHRDTCRSIRC